MVPLPLTLMVVFVPEVEGYPSALTAAAVSVATVEEVQVVSTTICADAVAMVAGVMIFGVTPI